MGSENKWELHSTEKLNPSTVCGCLTGKQNSRCLVWLVNSVDDLRGSSDLSPHELPGATYGAVYQVPISVSYSDVFYVDSKLVVCYYLDSIYFIDVLDGEVISCIYMYDIDNVFFFPSKRLLLLFVGNIIIKRFKIHNINKYLPLR